MKQKYINEIERLGWSIREYDDCYEIGQYSPAGEDFFFSVDRCKDIVQEVREYADDFDADEHAEMLVEARRKDPSVPQSIRELIDDADAIKAMLITLAEALENIKEKRQRKR